MIFHTSVKVELDGKAMSTITQGIKNAPQKRWRKNSKSESTAEKLTNRPLKKEKKKTRSKERDDFS